MGTRGVLLVIQCFEIEDSTGSKAENQQRPPMSLPQLEVGLLQLLQLLQLL